MSFVSFLISAWMVMAMQGPEPDNFSQATLIESSGTFMDVAAMMIVVAPHARRRIAVTRAQVFPQLPAITQIGRAHV